MATQGCGLKTWNFGSKLGYYGSSAERENNERVTYLQALPVDVLGTFVELFLFFPAKTQKHTVPTTVFRKPADSLWATILFAMRVVHEKSNATKVERSPTTRC